MTIKQRKILLFLVFFVISFILWFLNSLDQYYNTQIKIPIEFINLPPNKFIKDGNYKELTLTINGYGYDIIKYTTKNKITALKINLSNLKLKPVSNNDTNSYYLLSNELVLPLSSQLSPKIKIIEIKPDTLYITFSEMISRHIKVKPNIHITYAKQYINKGPIRIEPDKVLAKGPSYIIDTLQYIPTEHIQLTEVKQDINQQIKLIAPKGVKILPHNVWLLVKVEEYTEVRMTVPIKTINVPRGYNLITFPNQVHIKFNVVKDYYDKIKPDYFTFVVDYKDIQTSPTDKLPVKMLHAPDMIFSLSYFPHAVDYILEEKQQ